jgi:hypothetical protein
VGIQSIVATGTVYPGYSGNLPVTVSTTINTTSIPSSIALSFNNVPTGNNEWVTVDVQGYDGANGVGSHYDLGQLAGLVNIGSSTTSATITEVDPVPWTLSALRRRGPLWPSHPRSTRLNSGKESWS